MGLESHSVTCARRARMLYRHLFTAVLVGAAGRVKSYAALPGGVAKALFVRTCRFVIGLLQEHLLGVIYVPEDAREDG